VGIARFGDPAAADARPAGVLRGDQAEVRHQLPRMGEPSNVADLRDEAHRRHKRDPAQGLQGLYHRRPTPCGRELPELVGEPLDAAFGFVDRVAVLLQRDVLEGETDTEIGQPAAIRARPTGASRVATILAEQERLQPMLRLNAQADRVFARAHEITEGFIIGCRNVDRRKLAGAMQPGQGVAVPPIGLDPIVTP